MAPGRMLARRAKLSGCERAAAGRSGWPAAQPHDRPHPGDLRRDLDGRERPRLPQRRLLTHDKYRNNVLPNQQYSAEASHK